MHRSSWMLMVAVQLMVALPMRLVIQCAGTKQPGSGRLRDAAGREVIFVARPERCGATGSSVRYCHPDGDTPAQGMEMRAHDPPVLRGAGDDGAVGMRCTGCHQDHNLELARVPGAPHWQLAPRKMAWVGRTPRQICEQMKDPQRNGGRTLAQVVDHNAYDELVGWGWHPGHDREPAPGTQEQLGSLVAAWVESGAECPAEGVRP